MPRTKNKQKKLHVKRGDQVEVLSGNDKGLTGRVMRVYAKNDRILIEGVNMRIRHTKPNQQNQQGGRVEREFPIHVSNVLPLDGNGKATRVGRKWVENQSGRGSWKRYAKTTGEDLD